MSTLQRDLRGRLGEAFSVARPAIVTEQRSDDGTRKWLLRFADGQEVETVFIPEDDRGALCVSTQVGCTLTCTFCHTGTMPLVRNLGTAEIVAQMLVARDALAEWPTGREGRLFTNIVVMGMGEPLYNYDHTVAALRLPWTSTGSTCRGGGSPSRPPGSCRGSSSWARISASASRSRCTRCATSCATCWCRSIANGTSPRCWTRAAAIRRGGPITFEYVMLKDVNDSDADARELVRLLAGIPAKVNLIPFNAWPGAPYACSSNNRIHAFAAIVEAAGHASPVRTPRGRDILAACGQLKTESQRLRKRLATAA